MWHARIDPRRSANSLAKKKPRNSIKRLFPFSAVLRNVVCIHHRIFATRLGGFKDSKRFSGHMVWQISLAADVAS